MGDVRDLQSAAGEQINSGISQKGGDSVALPVRRHTCNQITEGFKANKAWLDSCHSHSPNAAALGLHIKSCEHNFNVKCVRSQLIKSQKESLTM